MKRYQTFRFRLTLQWVAVLSCLLGLFSLGVYFGLREILFRNLDVALWSIAASEVASATDAAEVHFHEVRLPYPLNRKRGYFDKFVQIRSLADGRLVAKSSNLGEWELPLLAQWHARVVQGEAFFSTVHRPASPPIRLVSLPIVMEGRVEYVMQVGASLASVQDTLHGLFWLLVIVNSGSLALTGLGGSLLARRALRPVDRIVRTVEGIASENLDHRLEVAYPHDEIGRLSGVLNRMLDRLEESFRSQQRFIADASHELRSPLANLRLAIEFALRRQRPVVEYRQVLLTILDEVERLIRLVQDLLVLGRADAGRLALVQDPVALQPLFHELMAEYELRAKQKGIAFTLAVPAGVVMGDRERLRQLFANLLENALRHTRHGGTIAVTGQRGTNTMQVCVQDTGIGIAPQHLPHIFERFYRVDQDRSRKEGGSGLGLAICQEIVRAHGGSLQVKSTVGVGTTFDVVLPLYEG